MADARDIGLTHRQSRDNVLAPAPEELGGNDRHSRYSLIARFPARSSPVYCRDGERLMSDTWLAVTAPWRQLAVDSSASGLPPQKVGERSRVLGLEGLGPKAAGMQPVGVAAPADSEICQCAQRLDRNASCAKVGRIGEMEYTVGGQGAASPSAPHSGLSGACPSKTADDRRLARVSGLTNSQA